MNFQVGQIYKMNVTERSHVTKSYYVEIIAVSKDSITTNIPNEHKLLIKRNGDFSNWRYHIPRMELIGDRKKFRHLLYFQKLD